MERVQVHVYGPEGPEGVDPWIEAIEKAVGLPVAEAGKLLTDLAEAGAAKARTLAEVDDPMPPTLLRVNADKAGALLTPGTVCVLAGEGGIAKSTMALSMALGVAALQDGQDGEVSGGLFWGRGGPVLLATYEDPPAWTAWKGRELAIHITGGVFGHNNNPEPAASILRRVHVLNLAGRPLFGPVASEPGAPAFYNARPGRLSGWQDLARACTDIRPRLVVVDPALVAFVGESNAAAPVREFFGALSELVGSVDAAALVVAHSTKAARGRNKDKADPFDAGQVGGSGAWTDGARAALTMTWRADAGDRVLAVAKSNYGKARILCDLESLRDPSGMIFGFGLNAGGEWRDEERTTSAPDRRRNKGAATTDGGGGQEWQRIE